MPTAGAGNGVGAPSARWRPQGQGERQGDEPYRHARQNVAQQPMAGIAAVQHSRLLGRNIPHELRLHGYGFVRVDPGTCRRPGPVESGGPPGMPGRRIIAPAGGSAEELILKDFGTRWCYGVSPPAHPRNHAHSTAIPSTPCSTAGRSPASRPPTSPPRSGAASCWLKAGPRRILRRRSRDGSRGLPSRRCSSRAAALLGLFLAEVRVNREQRGAQRAARAQLPPADRTPCSRRTRRPSCHEGADCSSLC